MLWRLRIVKFNSHEELVVDELVRRLVRVEDNRHPLLVLVKLVHIDLRPELDHVSEADILLSIPDEEGLGHE